MDMRNEATHLARHDSARAAAAQAASAEFLTFRLGGEEYGIDILRVQEIRSYEEPTRIANAPAFIKGVVNLRGVIVPVTGDMEIVPGVRVVHTPAHTAGGLTVLVDTAKGIAAITGFCVIMENLEPPKAVRAMEMEVIPPGTCTSPREAYDTLVRVKGLADILLPLHEPRFASMPSIPE